MTMRSRQVFRCGNARLLWKGVGLGSSTVRRVAGVESSACAASANAAMAH